MTRVLVGSGNALRRIWRGAKPKLLGLAFIAVIIGLIGVSIGFYNKDFTKVDMVTLRADRIGRQLDDNADVKIRGLIVGSVRSTSTTDTGASLRLAITPGDMKYIPANVEARILPKTLFGEKYVDLVVPDNAQGDPEDVTQTIKAGAVIPQDESQTAIELSTVFDDLVPVLTTVDPAKLSMTLNEISTALAGQGNNLGENLVKVDDYLKQFNPAVPQLATDISKLSDFADNLNNDAPALFTLLDQAAKESQNSQRIFGTTGGFHRLATATEALDTDLSGVLATNENGLINLGKVSAPTLRTLQQDGQELPYIFQAETDLTPRIDSALGGQGPFLHINLQFVTSRGPYTVTNGDCPTEDSGGGNSQDKAIGPNCPGYDKNAQNGGVVVPTKGSTQTTSNEPSVFAQPGTQAEQDQVASLVSPMIGQAPSQISGLADLVLAPQLRGSSVSLS